jgi:diketogulonate reductase-like aldo/keto reductase
VSVNVDVPSTTLNNGVEMPQLGLGTLANLPEAETIRIVLAALDAGYRAFDTATRYINERGVGIALREFGLPREETFITTKVWNTDQGREAAIRAFERSLSELGLDYVDLYLIHFPAPMLGRYLETWLTLEELYAEGHVRAIGVANFQTHHLDDVLRFGTIVPVVNQIELHPRLQQRTLRAFNARHGIATEAWSPLGMGVSVREPTLEAIAERHDATPAQVIIRWHLQQGTIVIPRSTNGQRIRENLEAANLTPLDDNELAVVDSLDTGARIGPHPDTWLDGHHDYRATTARYEEMMQHGASAVQGSPAVP